MADDISEKDITLAIEHPRGTEMRRLANYRDALRNAVVYAALPEADRDAIVRWSEIRRRIATEIDADPNNVMERLVPSAELRRIVIAGERVASGRDAFDDPGGDLRDAVALIRSANESRTPPA